MLLHPVLCPQRLTTWRQAGTPALCLLMGCDNDILLWPGGACRAEGQVVTPPPLSPRLLGVRI